MTQLNSYNGNRSLKQIGFAIEYTVEQIQEILKCKDDPIYFIKTYCKIVSLDSELLIPFELYPYQERFINAIQDHRRVISMQPRQMGKSQTVAAYVLWYTLFNNNKTVAILANKSDAAMEILSRYQLMYENVPLWMQQGIKTWNKGDVELENGSKIFTAATSSAGIRGKSVNLLYVDEVAIIPNNIADSFFTSVYPVVSAGETTKIILTSTPLGYNHFWKFWNEAEQGTNGFTPVEVKYTEHPKRDEKWAAEQKAILGEIKFNQEVLCAFLGSSNTLISADTIARLSPKPFEYSKEGLDIQEEPKRDRAYFITVDTSRGVGGDYSAFSVIDTTEYPFKVVAKYRDNKISPLLYPTIIHKVAKDYNNAFILVEINDIGQQVADIIHNDLEYENMIWVGSDTRYGQVLSSSGRSSVLGVRTTKQVKRIGCATLKSLVEENKLLVFDKDIISEFSTFIEHNGSFEADEGYNDDLTMTLVLFAWASNDPLFKDLMNSNNRQALYSQKMQTIEEELTPFGFIDSPAYIEEVEVAGGDVWMTDKYQKDYIDFLEKYR